MARAGGARMLAVLRMLLRRLLLARLRRPRLQSLRYRVRRPASKADFRR